MNKAFFISLSALATAATTWAAPGDLQVQDNVLINFGTSVGSISTAAWNNQVGQTYDILWYQGRITESLKNTEGNKSNIRVNFAPGSHAIVGSLDTSSDNLGIKAPTNLDAINQHWGNLHENDLSVSILEMGWKQDPGDASWTENGYSVWPNYGDITISELEKGATYAISAAFSVGQNWAWNTSGDNQIVSFTNGASSISPDNTYITTSEGTLGLGEAGSALWDALGDTSSFIMTWVFTAKGTSADITLSAQGWLTSGSFAGISAMGVTKYDIEVAEGSAQATSEQIITAVTNKIEGKSDMIPEPTTATLSLLALAAMVTRRRRK